MAKQEIIYSHRAQIKLFEILKFYSDRNKSTIYSKKLYNKFKKELSLLFKQPEIGIKTDIEFVRGLIIDDFIIFYHCCPIIKYIVPNGTYLDILICLLPTSYP